MDPLKKKKVRFSEEMDLFLLREVLGQNPFEDHSRWIQIQQALQAVIDVEILVRTLRDRLTLLLNAWFTKNKKDEKKSGIEEAVSEKDSLLQSIYDLKKESILRTNVKKNVVEKGKKLREKAIENIFLSNQPSPDTNEVFEDIHIEIVSGREMIYINSIKPFEDSFSEETNTEPVVLDSVNTVATPKNITTSVMTAPNSGSIIGEKVKGVILGIDGKQMTETPSRRRSQANIIGPNRKRLRGQTVGIDYLKQRSEDQLKIRDRELNLEEKKLQIEEQKIVLENEKLYLERNRLNMEEEKLQMELNERRSKLEQDDQMLKSHMKLIQNQQKLLEKFLEKM